jgi:DNA-binding MarR family transcriptional regulator
MLVALNEGITQTEIEEILQIPNGTASRNTSKLAQHVVDRKGGPKNIGLGLIFKAPDPDSSRRNALFLTEKGKEVAKGIAAVLGG